MIVHLFGDHDIPQIIYPRSVVGIPTQILRGRGGCGQILTPR